MLVFGDEGYPLILFPTSMGRYYESKDRGLINSLRWFADQQLVRIYCPDSVDNLSWYNKHISPAERAYNHTRYDKMLLHEVLERAIQETGIQRVAVAGCSFGGYHAANFAFRYPEKVSYLFSLSGTFDVRSRLEGFYDDNVYFNNPVDYMPGNAHTALWRMGIILGVADQVRIMPYDPRLLHHHRYQADFHPDERLQQTLIQQVTRLNQYLGYDFNTVEMAVHKGVPYAIDFYNPAPDADVHLVGEAHFEWIVETSAQYIIERARAQKRSANNLTWGGFLQQAVKKKVKSER